MDKNTKGLVSWEWMVAALVVGFIAGGALILFTIHDPSNLSESASECDRPNMDECKKPNMAEEHASSESGDDVLLDDIDGVISCEIIGDPFKVLKLGEVCPTNLLMDSLPRNQFKGAHVKFCGTLKDFGNFNKFEVDVSTNDMKVLAVNLYGSPIRYGKVDLWLTNCVTLCSRHFEGLEWGFLRDSNTGERDAFCARHIGDDRFGELFIVAKPNMCEGVQHGFIFTTDSPTCSVLHMEMRGSYADAFGRESTLFADRYLYRTVPVTSFER